MRIALNGFFWDQPHTGSGQYLHRLWDAFPALPESAGHEVVLLLPPGTAAPPPPGPGRRVIRGAPGPVAGRGPDLAKVWWEQVGVPALARRLGAAVLHTPYLGAPLRAPCPQVVTAHDLIPWVLPAYRGRRAVRAYLVLTARAARRARLVLANSRASRRDALRVLRLPPARVRTVYLGLEAAFGAPLPPAEIAATRARFDLPARYAFYIGGFDARKDVPLLLRAWAAALPALAPSAGPGPVLAIAGTVPPPGGLFPDVAGLARRLSLLGGPRGDAVRFLGRVSEADKRRLLAGADVFAFPSRYEGFGYDPLEAMAAGTPVVCADTSALPEIVGDAGLLLPPCEVDTWAEAIVRLWHDPALRADLAARGRARAARFTPETTAALTLRAYLDAAARGPLRGPCP